MARVEPEVTQSLGVRVLIANERPDRLAEVARVVRAIGHDVVEETVAVAEVGRLTRAAQPDVAVVAVGFDQDHALEQVDVLVEESACPVIVLLDGGDPRFVAEAARRGIFGHALHEDPDALQSSLEVALRRFAEQRELELAFRRRAIIERAKGVLMERHALGEQDAFELLRSHARRTQRRIVSVAETVLAAHPLLPGRRGPG